MSLNNSTVNSRLVFENSRSLLAQAGLNVANAKLTQSDLVLQQAASTTKTQYQFAILVNNNGSAGTMFNTEVRLNQQDAFIVSAMGFFLSKPTSSTDATYVQETYPNPVIFPTGAASLETFYNSLLQIAINNDIVLPVWHMGRHRYVPQSQKVAAAANQNGIGNDQIDLSNDGFLPIEPNIVMVGSKNNIITLTLPVAPATLDANTRLTLWMRGVLAQNSTIIT